MDNAQRTAALVDDPGAPVEGVIMADWMLGTACHLLGDQPAARVHCERGLARQPAGMMRIDDFGFDHRIRAQFVLARTLWLLGYPDRAAALALEIIDEAERRKHPLSMCMTLIYTSTIALWSGSLDLAAARISRLVTHATEYSFGPYVAISTGLRGQLALATGDAPGAIVLLRLAMTALLTERHLVLETEFAGSMAEALQICGEFAEASFVVEASLERAMRQEDMYDAANLLRIKASIDLSVDPSAVSSAEDTLRRSIAVARDQAAKSLGLRSATALSRLLSATGRSLAAETLLSEALGGMSEGHGTADLHAAQQLLEEIGAAA